MKRWLQRAVLILMSGFVLVYGGDWAVYKLRGSPQGKVTVTRYLSVPLKGNKTEYDPQGTEDLPCSISLFSQGSENTCWQLRRNTVQTTAL